jgi:hypothetical protein
MSPNTNTNTNINDSNNNSDVYGEQKQKVQTQYHLQSVEESFDKKAKQFIQRTEDHALQGLNPGGIYQAIWCRDASFILKSWFHSGNIQGLLQQISTVWTHQIEAGKEKIVYGRGSPEMKYKPTKATKEIQKKFEGALPTTIYQAGYSEVYGLNPDLDSTALMISTSSWVLTKILKNQINTSNSNIKNQGISTPPPNPSSELSKYSQSKTNTNSKKVIDYVVPRMINAVRYLQNRDIDNDGILEQSHNEDWMDTGLRAGKVVYSQACFILALNNLSYLLAEIGQDDESKKMMDISNRTINAVEKILWLEDKSAYIDILKSDYIGGPHRVLTQDVSLYSVAISENTNSDSLRIHQNNNNNNNINNSDISNQESNINKDNSISIKGNDDNNEHPLKQKSGKHDNQQQDKEENQQRFEYDNNSNNLDLMLQRSNRTLDSIKERVWLDKWPTNIETLLKESGPLHLKPYFYHNRTFWPWITGIEMMARSRFDRFDECDILLSKLASKEDIHISTFYEWVNPKTGKGGGAFPFRTGVCTVRTAIDHIIKGLDHKKRKDIDK